MAQPVQDDLQAGTGITVMPETAQDTTPGGRLTPETGFSGRLRWFMYGRDLSQCRLAALLHYSPNKVNAWLSKGRFPKRQYWPAIIAAGIATEAELLAWRPRRKQCSRLQARARFLKAVLIMPKYLARVTTGNLPPTCVGGASPASGGSTLPAALAGTNSKPVGVCEGVKA